MKRITLKQSWALAFGRYVKQGNRNNPQPDTEYQRLRDAAEIHGNILCWKCYRERQESADNCPHCGADCTPF